MADERVLHEPVEKIPMKMYVFTGISKLTNRYHSSGGLVVVAKNREHVELLIANHKHGYEDEFRTEITDDEWKRVIVYKLCGNFEPAVYVFPNAGCC